MPDINWAGTYLDVTRVVHAAAGGKWFLHVKVAPSIPCAPPPTLAITLPFSPTPNQDGQFSSSSSTKYLDVSTYCGTMSLAYSYGNHVPGSTPCILGVDHRGEGKA